MSKEYDFSWDDQDPEQIQSHFEGAGPEDNDVSDADFLATEEEDHEDSVFDPPCECCEECENSGFTQTECECTKCTTCGECENTCEAGICETCQHHEDECDCEKPCLCCPVCELNKWTNESCECAKCEPCLLCANSCVQEEPHESMSHVTDCRCKTEPIQSSNVQPNETQNSTKPRNSRGFRIWTAAEKSILRSLFGSGRSLADISMHLDRSENSVIAQLANQKLVSEVDLSNAVSQAQARNQKILHGNGFRKQR